VEVASFELLGRALRPPPAAWKGLPDVESRYRQRYLDLIGNPETRRIFGIRFATVAALREHLTSRGFVEVEGPMLGSVRGGASARPFVTHHNALDLDLYLRVALELHLKRLVVGGLDRVFEIGRVFRNEGIDRHHNPEFTMLEAYQAFADYRDMIELTEQIVVHAARAALDGTLQASLRGEPLDLTPPWPQTTLARLIEEKTGAAMHPSMPVEEARRMLDDRSVAYRHDWGPGRLMKELCDRRVQAGVRGPLFVLDYPREVSPLARVHREDPLLAERFELFVGGFELCNAFSEQNDPELQLRAFEAEARARQAGDEEASDVDLDYVQALEYGLPCTGGLGIGVDRLAMLLAGVDSIREVILFPTRRPEAPPPPPRSEALTREPAETAPSVAAARSAPAIARAVAPLEPLPHAGAVRMLAGLTALGGVIPLLGLVPPIHLRFPELGEALVPLWFEVTGQVVTLIIGLLLLFLADQLWKRKRRAWQVATALFGIAAVMDVLKGPHLVPAIYAMLMAISLALARRVFRAPPDPPSLLRVLRIGPIYVLAVLAFGISSLYVERGHVTPAPTLGGMLVTVLGGLVGVDGVYAYHNHFFARFFPAALLTLGVVGLAVCGALLFRPLVARPSHRRQEWEHAHRLVRSYGWDTLAYFALRDDKSFFFGSDGEAMIAYTYLGGYALVSGDPIGAPDSVPLVVREFLAFCRARAWSPAFLAVRESDVPLYSAHGLRHFYLGDEAIIHCDRFTLEGREMKGVRDAVRRIAKRYRFEMIRESVASAALVEQLNGISRRWRGKAAEHGFTMALSQEVRGQGRNAEFLLCIAFDDAERPGGFLRLVPAYGADPGYTLDLMRHDPDAPHGMTEFLVAQSALALKQRGIGRLSLNFAAFRRFFAEDVRYTLPQRLGRWLADALDPFFQIKSLYAFNARFLPEWKPRVIVFREPTDLPRVGVLYIGAEGLLAIPGIGPLLVPRSTGGASSSAP
jgi:lysyl-tRNA synthetase